MHFYMNTFNSDYVGIHFLFLLNFKDTNAEDVPMPENVVALMGTRCFFGCRSPNGNKNYCRFNWYFTLSGTDDGKLIYNGYNLLSNYQSRYAVETVDLGGKNIVIRSADRSYAGLYTIEKGGSLSKESAELVVIGTYRLLLVALMCRMNSSSKTACKEHGKALRVQPMTAVYTLMISSSIHTFDL